MMRSTARAEVGKNPLAETPVNRRHRNCGYFDRLPGVYPLMKLIRRSAVLLVVLALAAVCTIGVYSYQLKRSANDVVRIAYELSQKGKPPTTQEIQQRFGKALKQ